MDYWFVFLLRLLLNSPRVMKACLCKLNIVCFSAERRKMLHEIQFQFIFTSSLICYFSLHFVKFHFIFTSPSTGKFLKLFFVLWHNVTLVWFTQTVLRLSHTLAAPLILLLAFNFGIKHVPSQKFHSRVKWFIDAVIFCLGTLQTH